MLVKLMKDCWEDSWGDRPGCAEILARLEAVVEQCRVGAEKRPELQKYELAWEVACADGVLAPEEKETLEAQRAKLGITDAEQASTEARWEGVQRAVVEARQGEDAGSKHDDELRGMMRKMLELELELKEQVIATRGDIDHFRNMATSMRDKTPWLFVISANPEAVLRSRVSWLKKKAKRAVKDPAKEFRSVGSGMMCTSGAATMRLFSRARLAHHRPSCCAADHQLQR